MTTDLKTVMELDDDDIDDDAYGPDYLWFQRPAPSFRFTFLLAGLLMVWTWNRHRIRVEQMKSKFARHEFKGLLRFSALVSAYMDNDEPTFALARLFTKSLLFLGLLQIDYHLGFLGMLGLLVLESNLDATRLLLAYWNCRSLRDLRRATASQDEAKEIRTSATQLEPTNVYEDLTRPMSIAVMVFLVQSLLIGIVMFDSYSTPTRSCFNGTEGCPMLASLGSYCLYYMGTFMACVFYVGPMNSYGKKEHDPVYWLKLFLMSKQTASVVSWKDSVTDQTKTLNLRQNDWRIWLRFVMSFVINSVCFHFLLHVLPVQIASKSSIMGVVFSSVGMIYLVDLDDTCGNVMTLVTHHSGEQEAALSDATDGYDSVGQNMNGFEAEKQRIIDEAIKEMRAKLEALTCGPPEPSSLHHKLHMESISHVLLLSTEKKDNDDQRKHHKSEDTPLMSV